MMKLLKQIIFVVIISQIYFRVEASGHASAPAPASQASTVCAKTTTIHPTNKKPRVVLVHGFLSGGWYWYKVRLSLETMGYNVTSIDLKGAGIDPTDVATIETFEEYNEPLDRFMARLPKHEKVVIAGHSAGGVSVTKILHDYPEKVQVALYVAATMIRNGYTTCDHLVMGVPHFNESKCSASCPTLPEPTCFAKGILPNHENPPIGSMEAHVLGKSLARTGPYRALCTSKFTDKATGHQASSIDKVPRIYVKTLHDRELHPSQQAAMIKLWPPCEIHEIMNDHDAPASKPELISAFIVRASLLYGG